MIGRAITAHGHPFRVSLGTSEQCIAIVTDSSACLWPQLAAEHGVEVVQQWVHVWQQSFRDNEIPCRDACRWASQRARVSTSGPSLGDFQLAYERAARQAEAVVVITLGSGLSATYAAAVAAAREFRTCPVEVVDSGTALGALGLIVLAAAQTARAGAPREAVAHRARQAAEQARLFATVESLDYAARSGRAPILAAYLSSALSMFPVLEWRAPGAAVVGRARTFDDALDRLIAVATDGSRPERLAAFVFHADAPQRAAAVARRLAERLAPEALFQAGVPPSAGVHMGAGAIGVGLLPGW